MQTSQVVGEKHFVSLCLIPGTTHLESQ